MAKTKIDPDAGMMVLFEELAARTGGSLEVASYWVERVGAPVLRDWAGRECVAAADARKAVEAYEADRRAHEERERERAQAVTAWEREREHVWRQAYEAALPGFVREDLQAMAQKYTAFTFPTGLPPSTPAARARAQEAARAAVERWEKRHPRPA